MSQFKTYEFNYLFTGSQNSKMHYYIVVYLTEHCMNQIFKLGIFATPNSVFQALFITKIFIYDWLLSPVIQKRKQHIQQLIAELPWFLPVFSKIYKTVHVLFSQIGIDIEAKYYKIPRIVIEQRLYY